jgi:hypothetical protein
VSPQPSLRSSSGAPDVFGAAFPAYTTRLATEASVRARYRAAATERQVANTLYPRHGLITVQPRNNGAPAGTQGAAQTTKETA